MILSSQDHVQIKKIIDGHYGQRVYKVSLDIDSEMTKNMYIRTNKDKYAIDVGTFEFTFTELDVAEKYFDYFLDPKKPIKIVYPELFI